MDSNFNKNKGTIAIRENNVMVKIGPRFLIRFIEL